MNGGLASSAARRVAAPEPASRTRRETPVRTPALALPRLRTGGLPEAPTTRDRLQASFGAEAPRAAIPELPVAPGREPELPEAEPLTMRARIVNRALAAPEAAPEPSAAVVVDIA